MSTSDQQDHGPLTRKQLREIRLTGSTPVITPEEAAAAAEAAPPAPPLPRATEKSDDAVSVPVVDETAEGGGAPLTRRQAREQERIKTASVPVVDAEGGESDTAVGSDTATEAADEDTEADNARVEHETIEPPLAEPQVAEPQVAEPQVAAAPSAIVSGLPDFTAPAPADTAPTNIAPTDTAPADTAGDDDDIDDEIVIEPVRASEAAESVGIVPLEVVEEPTDAGPRDDVAAVFGLSDETEPESGTDDDDVLADVGEHDDDDVVKDPRPTVNSAFGEGLLADEPETHAPFRPSFDELLTVGDSTGSQHSAPNALIFTPSPGEGSLSGPVASTGEILVTGSYELPRGLGSQGHAHGTTDGKDIDAVLIDGELAPASSPTPIAASAAVSTIKPAGEVIRPPAPEKGNKLMLILAIVAGGLALALGVALVFAFTTNVF